MFFAADTSALVALSAIGRLDLLRLQAAEVWLPPAIVRELITDGFGWANAAQAQGEFQRGEWLLPWTATISLMIPASRRLGQGEIEAVSLAAQQSGTCLIDDRRGRAFAQSLGVQVIGAPGILRRSKIAGVIPAVKPLLLEIVKKGIYYAPDFIARILADLNE